MASDPLQALIEEGTFQFTIGENDTALRVLGQATHQYPDSFEAWHALAEVMLAVRDLDGALAAANKAEALRPDDLFIHTTLSRIWMERGDKIAAEKHSARAKVLGWREELRHAPASEPPFGVPPPAPKN